MRARRPPPRTMALIAAACTALVALIVAVPSADIVEPGHSVDLTSPRQVIAVTTHHERVPAAAAWACRLAGSCYPPDHTPGGVPMSPDASDTAVRKAVSRLVGHLVPPVAPLEVRGTSGALAQAVAAWLEATGSDLGQVVALTGSVGADATVGVVADIEAKAAAATGLGAGVLVVPAATTARAAGFDGRVIPATTLPQVIDDLCSLPPARCR